jgi:hypothetical protein
VTAGGCLRYHRLVRVAIAALAMLLACCGGQTTGSSGGSDGGGPEREAPGSDWLSHPSGDAGRGTGDTACATASAESTLTKQPSDIVFLLDNSGSMSLEASWVQQNMNGFSQQIAASGIDFHVVVVSSYPGDGNGICVDPPLGAGGCPNTDSKPPAFLHVNQEVGSTNGLALCLSTYPQWKSALRTAAAKHIVIVTDDNSSMPAATFDSQLKALDPPTFAGYKFNGIFSYTKCPTAAKAGTVYQTLVQQTGGVSGDLCLQSFKPVFDKLATAVVAGSKIACDIPMPKPPPGKKVNLYQVTVEVAAGSGAAPQKIPRVDGAGQCGTGGWYYDSSTAPSRIVLCPSTCAWAQGLAGAKLAVGLGCLAEIE